MMATAMITQQMTVNAMLASWGADRLVGGMGTFGNAFICSP